MFLRGIGRDSLLNPEMTIADEKTEPSSAAELEPSAVRRKGRCGHEVTPSTVSYLPDPEAAGRCRQVAARCDRNTSTPVTARMIAPMDSTTSVVGTRVKLICS